MVYHCRYALEFFFVSPAAPTTDKTLAMPSALPLRSRLRYSHTTLWVTVLLRLAMVYHCRFALEFFCQSGCADH